MAECRITVLKRTLHAELAEEYLKQKAGPCPVFREGQEFVSSSAMERPPGFCDWARESTSTSSSPCSSRAAISAGEVIMTAG